MSSDIATAEAEGKDLKEELILSIDGVQVEVDWEENESVAALRELVARNPLTIQMSMYGGFEQVGPLGTALPRRDVQTHTDYGDIVLYSGNQIVVFHGSNSWAYTRLGHIRDLSRAELKEMLGQHDVTITLAMSAAEEGYRIPDVTLNSGYPMPVIGLGTWTLSDDQAEASVYTALKTGMRLIDTARYYGNEVGVGRGIRRAMDDGIATREEIFVTSKIMPSDYERAAQGIDNSLRDLGLDYVDLMLIHQPGWNDEAVYRAMEQAVRDGKIRSIGISNYYTPEAVEEILSFAEIMPAVIQNENHLYYQNKALQAYVQQYGIVVESWYPFGGRGHTQEHFTNETVVRIANAHGKTPAQIILRWQIQDGYITIPGSSNPDHIAENYDVFDFELTNQEMMEIRDLDRQARYENWYKPRSIMNKPTIWLERIRLRAFCITFRQCFCSILCGDNLLSNFFMRTLLNKLGIDYLLFRTNEDIVAHNENAVNSDHGTFVIGHQARKFIVFCSAHSTMPGLIICSS